jgi:hypothetical protein
MTASVPASPPRRWLALIWIGAAIPTALVALLLLALSEQDEARVAGWVLAGLAVTGVVLGGWLTGRGRHASPAASLALSAVWAVAALALWTTQDFLADRLWVSGVPLVVAVVTAVVAVREREEH